MAKFKLLQGKHVERIDGKMKTYVAGDVVEFDKLPEAFADRFEPWAPPAPKVAAPVEPPKEPVEPPKDDAKTQVPPATK